LESSTAPVQSAPLAAPSPTQLAQISGSSSDSLRTHEACESIKTLEEIAAHDEKRTAPSSPGEGRDMSISPAQTSTCSKASRVDTFADRLRAVNMQLCARAAKPQLQIGSRVRVVSSRPDLTGLEGVVIEWNNERNRWKVRTVVGSKKLLSAANLELVSNPRSGTVAALGLVSSMRRANRGAHPRSFMLDESRFAHVEPAASSIAAPASEPTEPTDSREPETLPELIDHAPFEPSVGDADGDDDEYPSEDEATWYTQGSHWNSDEFIADPNGADVRTEQAESVHDFELARSALLGRLDAPTVLSAPQSDALSTARVESASLPDGRLTRLVEASQLACMAPEAVAKSKPRHKLGKFARRVGFVASLRRGLSTAASPPIAA